MAAKRKVSPKRAAAVIVITVVMVAMTISFIYPLVYMLLNSVKDKNEYYRNAFGLPYHVTLDNFKSIFLDYHIGTNIINTVIVVVISTILVLFTSLVAAYAFAKLKFRGKRIVYVIIMATMFLPAQVTMIPRYVMFTKLGLIDSLGSLIFTYWAGGIPGTILLLSGTISGIPQEVIESAKIDGAGFFSILFKMVLPMSMSGIAISIIFEFINCWNDYLNPLIYITTPSKQTIMVVLSQMMSKYVQYPTRQFAGLFLSVIPTIVIYLCLQKHMIGGVTSGAVK